MSVPIPASEVICWRCKEKGHYASGCPNPAQQMGYVLLCQNCNEPGHIAPHCTKPLVQRPKVNFVTTASTSGTKNDVSVQLADWETETKATSSDPVSKIRFDPQVITIPSSPEGWPSDSAWDTFGVSTMSKGETKTVSTREEKKKKGKKPVEVSVETSSDLDSEPVKRDIYKDDISSIVREALKNQNQVLKQLNAWSRGHKKTTRGMRRRKKMTKDESIAAYAITEEDRGAPEVDIEICGCLIQHVPLDSDSGVNIMTESTATRLGLPTLPLRY
ncbi:hypothetical protein R1sor_024212 [Riccia sorocarpa]|uniref:CCHC-type domain-containing protein n=1 Tax=Riccia sorocarpa TaxID=122646 RepID=A0ABD3GRQ1_9MARC